MTKAIKVNLSDECHGMLRKAADRQDMSMSAYVNQLIKDVDIASKEIKVILSVPESLTKRNNDAMKQWLQVRMDAIVQAYYPEEKKKNVIDSQAN